MTTRKELYERIRATSKDEVVLEEMIRLGFWSGTDLPGGSAPQTGVEEPTNELAEIRKLEQELQTLAQRSLGGRGSELIKAEQLRRRLQLSREKRAARKVAREMERTRRAADWAARNQREITYLGAGVSSALGQRDGRAKEGLPDVQSAAAIANAMNLSVPQLRFLSFHRKVSAVRHWRTFLVPKKTGGTRKISAPMPRLKAAQRWVLQRILEKVPVHDAAHGFVRGRSIVTNAVCHVGRDVVVNFDLKDFFPTLNFHRVRGLFGSLGYSREAATILALLCTEADSEEVEIDGRRWFVHRTERRLPQGSPCSPAITNLVCVRLDQRLTGLARQHGYTYTRYADDLTFSGPLDGIGTLMGAVRAIVEDEGFQVHPDKTRIMRKGSRQEVTGLVVNERLGVPRAALRRWRATVHQIDRDGPAGKRFGRSPDIFAALFGFAAFVYMVQPDRGRELFAELVGVAERHGWSPPRRQSPPSATRTTPQRPFWQFWKWFERASEEP